jgi:putative ubiquitin-RnfH superfamily antitoxin RatB of RatAB toxin-antitoxin module
MATESNLRVTVAYSLSPRNVTEVALELPPGSTATDAVRKSGALELLSEAELRNAELGVWGKKVTSKHLLRENDRVEIYRPLKVDPKVARRERFQSQGAKSAGLFTNLRKGAKAGY